jgi:hypothetical protein
MLDPWLQVANFVVLVLTFLTLCRYAWDTNRMKRELLSQGSASRRPFFIIEAEDESFNSRALLCNVGQGIALRTSWRFLKFEPIETCDWVCPVGAVAVKMKTLLLFKSTITSDAFTLPTRMIDAEGIRIEYEDTAGKRYWSTVKKTIDNFLAVDTGEIAEEVGETVHEPSIMTPPLRRAS